MDHKTVEEYVLSMPNARLDYPFGKEVAVYKVFVSEKSSVTRADGVQGTGEQQSELYEMYSERAAEPVTPQSAASTGSISSSAGKQASAARGDWKMFALIQEGKDPVRISLKCDPELAKILREKYEEVQEGYHLNKKHWNTIVLSGQLAWEEVQALIRHSYELVAGSNNKPVGA